MRKIRKRGTDGRKLLNQEVQRIRKDAKDIKAPVNRVKIQKVVGPDYIHMGDMEIMYHV